MKKLLLLPLLLILFFWVLPVPHPAVPAGTVVLDTHGKILKVFLSEDESWHIPLQEEKPIPEKLFQSVRIAEDKLFEYHHGIDPLAIVRAAHQNLRAGHVVSGASTITMQLARLLDPKPRTLKSKIIEVFQAYKLELRYSKEEILRHYLDLAPYGGNVVGARAAALRTFGREIDRLTWAEACTLAVLPRAPSTVNIYRGRPTLLERRNNLLAKLRGGSIIDENDYRASLRERLPARARAMPGLAPHLSVQLRLRREGEVIQTTLDPVIQRMAEETAMSWNEQMRLYGIDNVAVVIAETQTGKVRAYVGSGNFNDPEHQGEVDGVAAARSSGSILKPFLYGLAIQRGSLLPETLLPDIPMRFGRFQPVNSGRTHDGAVTVHEALTRSLNIPAVWTLRSYGVIPFHRFLTDAGLTTITRSSGDYGLTLVVGGAEVTLLEMTGLYRGLGRGGLFSGVTFLESEELPPERRLLSPGAAHLVLNILKDVRRPGWEYTSVLSEEAHPLAWKTGTSFRQRDAWAMGVSPDWTIGVWVGNFTGEGNQNLIGSKTAGPLLFQIYQRLEKKQGWFTEPVQNLKTVKICTKTGFAASASCPDVTEAVAPSNTPPLLPCPYHRSYHIDTGTGREVCSLCWNSDRVAGESRLIFPPKIAAYLRAGGESVDEPPIHSPSCPSFQDERLIQFLYPEEGGTVCLPKDFDGTRQKLVVRAAHQQRESRLYWFLDDHYAGETIKEHAMGLSLPAGDHIVEVVDPDGHTREVQFTVLTTKAGSDLYY